MAYQVLARKWRPQDFSALVGQEAIVTALRNAIREGRIAHAYLFSGIRGVGKTTTARLLAKALNCERGPTGDPCNECAVCQEITRGGDLDVIEVDAATYSKVEQVRELTESLRYRPARDRFKVVVLDEIHRLSRQAFDALLKIVEEPPSHLVFIFATTEIEAVPATILSRCQEFRFRRVPLADMVAHLRQISDAEGIHASETALRLVARAGEGSVRDAVALLDQLATFGAGTVGDDDAARLAGNLESSFFIDLLSAILVGDALRVVAASHRLEEEGWDPRHVYSQFLGFCRDGLHLALGGAPEQTELPSEDAAALREVALAAGYENLLRLLHLSLASEQTVRRSDSGGLALEIAWLRAAELPKLLRIESLLSGELGSAAAAGSGPAGVRTPALRPPAPAAPPPAPARAPRAAAQPEALPPKTAPVPREAPRTGNPVALLLEEIGRRKQPLAAHLQSALRLVVEGDTLLVYLPAGDAGDSLLRTLERPANRGILDESLSAVIAAGARWRAVPNAGGEARSEVEPASSRSAKSSAIEEASRLPDVQKVLDIFGGDVVDVTRNSRVEEDA